MLNGFMYGNVFEDEERVQRQAVFPRLLCQNAADFSFVSHSHTDTAERRAWEHDFTSFSPRISLGKAMKWISPKPLKLWMAGWIYEGREG